MITAGIDVGLENTKVVILKDGQVIGRSKGRTGGAARTANITRIVQEALEEAKVASSEVERTIATGKGKHDATMADDIYTEVATLIKAARFLYPDAEAVVDAGADETLIATFHKTGNLKESAINQKCSAGIGTFLRYMADRLDLTQEEMSDLSPASPTGPTVSDGCVVFSELDALSLLNRGTPAKEIASAIIETAAVRVSTVIVEPTLPVGDKIVLAGGLSHNTAFVSALEKHTGSKFIIPGEAEYIGALGAALIAVPVSE